MIAARFPLPVLGLLAVAWLQAGRLHAQAPPDTAPVRIDSLTLDQAVLLALGHQPLISSAEASVHSADAGLTQATAAYLPSITSTASAQRTEGAFVFNPDFAPRDQKYNNYSAAIQAQQTLFDFGRTINRVSAGGRLLDAAEADYQSARASTVVATEVAYFTLIQSLQLVGVSEQAVDQAAKHLKEAQAFYSVGRRAQSDVTRAEVDLANAEVGLIHSRNQAQVAKLQLENSMGVHPARPYGVRQEFDTLAFPLPLDSAKAIALRARPEVTAAEARLAASRSLAAAAWDQHLPIISASGTYTWTNFNFPLFSRWNAGLTVNFPIFQGFAIQAQVDQARAAADVASANLDLLRQNVLLDVEQNYLGLAEARDRILATAKLVEHAEENLNLAERQYAAGVGTSLEVTDAQVARANARTTRIQALYDYNSSLVRLRRAMGTPVP